MARAQSPSWAPHYFIHQAAGASLSAPPTTAFTPSQIRHAYGFDLVTNQGAGQTIALVDAYDDANAANDLAVFSKQFNLPACTAASGPLRQLYSSGLQARRQRQLGRRNFARY